jgi:transposase
MTELIETETKNGQPRKDGWTPAAQRLFLETLAGLGVARTACAVAGMSHEAAYSFRNRAAGLAFKMGWDAALLLARARLVDDLMTRAIDGQEDVLRRDRDADEVRRARHDNRLAQGMLTRLDKQSQTDDSEYAPHRLIAQDWEAFLDLIERGMTSAGLGLFLASRRAEEGDELAELLGNGQCQLRLGEDEGATDEPVDPQAQAAQMSVWFDDEQDCLCTDFPPPPDFDGMEEGRFGDEGYQRGLTDQEALHFEALRAVDVEPLRIAGAEARDLYFGFRAVRPKKRRKAVAFKESGQRPYGERGSAPTIAPNSADANEAAPWMPTNIQHDDIANVESDRADREPQTPAHNLDEFTSEGVRIYHPGTREFTPEYQRVAGFRVIKPWPKELDHRQMPGTSGWG